MIFQSTKAVDYVIYFIWNIFDILIIVRYMNHLYGKPDKYLKIFPIFLILISLLTTISMSPTKNYVNLAAITSMSFFLLIFYISTVQKKVLFSVISLAIAGISSGISYCVFYILLEMKNDYVIFDTLFTHLLFWILLELAPNLYKNNKPTIPYRIWILLLSMPAASIVVFVCILFMFSSSNLQSKEIAIIGLPILLLLLFINIIVFFLFDRFSALFNTITENALLEQQISFQEQHYKQLESTQNRIRSIRHDVRNNLQMMSYLLKKREINDLEEYLNSLCVSIDSVEQVISTQNQALDSILNIKISEMQDNNIDVNSEIIIPEGLKISFEQSVILIGNIMDNALEACLKLSEPERKVQLKISYTSQILFISLNNPVIQTSFQNNEELVSNKDDTVLHGLGLKNVQRVVNEFNGTMNTEIKDNQFRIKLVLYGV